MFNVPHTSVCELDPYTGPYAGAICPITRQPLDRLSHPVVNRDMFRREGVTASIYALQPLLRWYETNPTYPDNRQPLDLNRLEEVSLHTQRQTRSGLSYPGYVDQTRAMLEDVRRREAPPSSYMPTRQHREQVNILFRERMSNLTRVVDNIPSWLRTYWEVHPFTREDMFDIEPPSFLNLEYANDAVRKAFRLSMAELLEIGADYIYAYWNRHPLTYEDDDEIVQRFHTSIQRRGDSGNPIASYLWDIGVVSQQQERQIFRERQNMFFRCAMSNIMLSIEITPSWFAQYWSYHPYTEDERGLVPDPGIHILMPNPLNEDMYKQFRTDMADNLRVNGPNSRVEYVYEYWNAHPISDRDHPDVLRHLLHSINEREMARDPITQLLDYPPLIMPS